jgi:eukaryotic-like serine/threonine-protein kinase
MQHVICPPRLDAAQFHREGEAAMRARSEQGPTFEEIATRVDRLPVPTVVDWVLQAIEAIAQAHSYGVVHGQLSLAKMLLTPGGPARKPSIKVDFGQRRMTGESASGSSSPSRCDVDVGPDVRALGVILYRLLFHPRTGTAAPRTSVPPDLEVAVRRCLDEHPGRRFASVAELARALAPFGTAAAVASSERVECLLEDRVFELTRPKRLPEVHEESPPDDATPRKRPYAAPASGRVVLLALAMLAALGAAAFTALYRSVPRGEPPASFGVTEMQP